MPIKPNVIAADTYVVANVVVAVTETALLTANNLRVEAVMFNNGANTIFVGPTGVSIGTGLPVVAGAAFSLDGQTALFGIVAAATEPMRTFVLEDD